MSLRVHHLGRIEYGRALALQQDLVTRKLAGDDVNHLLLLEHDPVYTLGRGANEADLCCADERLGVPVFRVGRGGGVTFHGPGQLVAYPILTLPKAGRDVHRYVHNLEDVLIAVCAEFSVAARRHPDEIGVWVEGRKIASIGVGVRRWTTLHGVSLNVSTDLAFFSAVVPCRTPGLPMTSLQQELGWAPSMATVEEVFVDCFYRVFGIASEPLAATEGVGA